MEIINEDKVEPTKRRLGAISDERIAAALIACQGRQCHAADMLGCSLSCVNKRIHESEYLKEILNEAIERRLDDAEKVLSESIINCDKNLGGVCFLLKTKGKHRGYTEQAPIFVSPEVMDMFTKQMNQLANLQQNSSAQEERNISESCQKAN